MPFTKDINYKTSEMGQTKIHKVKWVLPYVNKLFQTRTYKELRSDAYENTLGDNDSTFNLKIKLLGRENDIMEIYYLYPKTIFLKTVLISNLNQFQDQLLVQNEFASIEANSWQYLFTLFKRDVIAAKGILQSNGSLSLQFEFYVRTDVNVAYKNVSLERLSCDFESLLHSESFFDVIMKSSDGYEYKVHKAILAARSEVLKANFQHNTLECQTNILESPFESATLSAVINFIYSGKIVKIDEIPDSLLVAANYYQLKELKNLCEEALHSKLTVDNVIETLKLADLYSAEILKQKCLEFIKNGQAKLIVKTEGWAKEESGELIKLIYKYVIDDGKD
ncbi:unnamed protein product [Danaus chrysippus]|uniref:(African queen) hypothetical protein n=1 Tax=Danaus chrysippus TaxID=151541 RepID=A0A8J2QVH2_9NEOP|nr:unnamed protein product [Danaus chrysippus]